MPCALYNYYKMLCQNMAIIIYRSDDVYTLQGSSIHVKSLYDNNNNITIGNTLTSSPKTRFSRLPIIIIIINVIIIIMCIYVSGFYGATRIKIAGEVVWNALQMEFKDRVPPSLCSRKDRLIRRRARGP